MTAPRYLQSQCRAMKLKGQWWTEQRFQENVRKGFRFHRIHKVCLILQVSFSKARYTSQKFQRNYSSQHEEELTSGIGSKTVAEEIREKVKCCFIRRWPRAHEDHHGSMLCMVLLVLCCHFRPCRSQLPHSGLAVTTKRLFLRSPVRHFPFPSEHWSTPTHTLLVWFSSWVFGLALPPACSVTSCLPRPVFVC